MKQSCFVCRNVRYVPASYNNPFPYSFCSKGHFEKIEDYEDEKLHEDTNCSDFEGDER